MPDLVFQYCPMCATALIEREVAHARRSVCPACNFVQFRGPRAVAVVVAYHEETLLFGRRNIQPRKGFWNFCGGYVDLGETIEDAAIREAREEANLDLELERLVGVYSANAGSHVVIAYQARIPTSQLSRIAAQQEEVSELAFFHWDTLPSLAFPEHHDILRDWRQLNS